MSDFIRWPIFSHLQEEFLCTIKLALVFGNSGNEAIMVTHDDQVFATGSNISSCLGLGDQQSCLLPRKVESLCNKRISDLSFGSGPHVLGLTGNGVIVCRSNIKRDKISQGRLGVLSTAILQVQSKITTSQD